MRSGRINTLQTSQDAPGYIWHHTKHAHAAGSGSVTVTVKLPKTMHVDGFPVAYAVAVTPSHPCAASVRNQMRYGFDVVLSSLDGGALAAGVFSVVVVG
jgi:hypothetical protein